MHHRKVVDGNHFEKNIHNELHHSVCTSPPTITEMTAEGAGLVKKKNKSE